MSTVRYSLYDNNQIQQDCERHNINIDKHTVDHCKVATSATIED